jgi:hypothetical protein
MNHRAAAAAVAALAISATAHAGPAPGGSNYDWYRVGSSGAGSCDREPYGVVPNFGEPAAREQITGELRQMAAAGQRRLRIGIFHGHGLDTGTIMDSSGGDLSQQNRRNLAGLLAAIKAAGFEQVEVAFHPEGPAIRDWRAWDQARYWENWQLIRHLRPIIRAAGLPYRIDLSNEAIPPSGQPLIMRYARTLWRDYVKAFGRQDTVGFSVIGDPDHVGHLRDVYGSTPPYTFDIHLYGGTAGLSEYEQFSRADTAMRRAGLRQPWIIGEAFYDDPTAAAELSSAIGGSTRTVYYLTQWPLTRAGACPDVDVGAPVAFDAYAAAGFDPLPARLRRPRPVLGTVRLERDGRIAVPIRCLDTTTRCFGTIAVRGSRARSFSVYGAGVVTRRIRPPTRGAHGVAITVTAHSEDSVDVVRRTIRVQLTRRLPAATSRRRASGSWLR